MGIKRHGSGGFMATDGSGRFVSGTKSGTWIGAAVALMFVPLVGFGVAAPGILSSFFMAQLALVAPFVVVAGAGLASVWGLVKLWSSAIWLWVKVVVSTLAGWIFWESVLYVAEFGVEALPTLSEIKAWF